MGSAHWWSGHYQTAKGLIATPDSRLTASSQRGVDGLIDVSTLSNDVTSGLAELSGALVQARLVTGFRLRTSCYGGQDGAASGAASSSSARRPARRAVGEGGQPLMCRSTGITADTPPSTA